MYHEMFVTNKPPVFPFVYSRGKKVSDTHDTMFVNEHLNTFETTVSAIRAVHTRILFANTTCQTKQISKPKAETAFACPNLEFRNRIPFQRNQLEAHLQKNALLSAGCNNHT